MMKCSRVAIAVLWLAAGSAIALATPPAYHRENMEHLNLRGAEEKWLAANVPPGLPTEKAREVLRSAGYQPDKSKTEGRLTASKKVTVVRPWEYVKLTITVLHQGGAVVEARVESELVLGRRLAPWHWFPVYEVFFER
ncbi:MAG: hypothetical protein U0793_13705 [Gemmataceae bacterium]